MAAKRRRGATGSWFSHELSSSGHCRVLEEDGVSSLLTERLLSARLCVGPIHTRESQPSPLQTGLALQHPQPRFREGSGLAYGSLTADKLLSSEWLLKQHGGGGGKHVSFKGNNSLIILCCLIFINTFQLKNGVKHF